MNPFLSSLHPGSPSSYGGALRVLIVDEIEADQKRVANVFEHHEIAVVVAHDMQDAVQRIGQDPFDFICVSLPGQNGTEKHVFRALKSSEANQRTPLFILTANGGQALGADGHDGLVKVFHKQDLSGFFQYVTDLAGLIHKNCFFKGRMLYVGSRSAGAQSLQNALQRMGLNVMHLYDHDRAYTAFTEEDFDVILVGLGDKHGPHGVQFVQRLRAEHGQKAQVPILAVAESKRSPLMEAALRAGATDCLGRSVSDEELQCRLRNLLLIKNLLDKVDHQEKELRELVMTDDLTGLYSKPYLFNAGSQRANEAYRHNVPLSLIVFGIDHFQHVNDRYGQSIGDMVLQEMAKILRTFSRQEDIVARVNDDEFALALPHCHEQAAVAKVDRLRAFVESSHPSGIPVTASFGVALLPSSFPCDFEDLYSAADRAMAQAKVDGRNRAVMSELVPSDSGLLKVVLKTLQTT